MIPIININIMNKNQNGDCSSDEIDDLECIGKMPNMPIPNKMNNNNLHKQKYNGLDWKDYFDQ